MSNTERLMLSSRLRYRAVGDEGVLVQLDSGRVIVVNEVGLHIVKQLDAPKTKAALIESITAAFDVEEAQAEHDLEQFLTELDEDQVLEHQYVSD